MKIGITSTGPIMGLSWGSALLVYRAADAPQSPQAQLMKLTDGNRVKVVWDQGTEQDSQLKYDDSRDDKIAALPLKQETGLAEMEDRSAPLLTAVGTRACFEPSWGNIGRLKPVFAAAGKVDQDNPKTNERIV